MHIKEKYKEILFILDTCEGFTLFDSVDVPNIYFVTSSVKDQKAHSYSFDLNIMSPTSDRFHHIFKTYLEWVYKNKKFNYKLNDLFSSLQKEKKFIESDVTIKNQIKREIIFEEFFGNYLNKNSMNVKYDLVLCPTVYPSNTSTSTGTPRQIPNIKTYTFDENQINQKLNQFRKNEDKEVLNIKKYTENNFKLNEKKVISDGSTLNQINFRSSEGHLPMNTIFMLILIYLIYNIIKS
jgi:glycosylphosphatidylinositol transamidase (GPIT) subunit GPI8